MGLNPYKIEPKQGELFLRSVISEKDEYKWIHELLKSHERHGLLYKDLDKLPKAQQSFLQDIFPQVYQLACDEWDDDGEEVREDWEDRMTCTLCGRKDNKYIKYIRNKITGERINLGSSCIETYNNSKDFNTKDEKRNRKLLYEIKRKNKLNEASSGIISTIENWNKFLNTLPIFVSKKLENEYTTIGQKIDDVYKKYLKSGQPIYINQLQSLCDELEMVKIKIEKYIQSNQTKEFAQTKEIKQWCKMNNEKTAIEWLKEEGQVTIRTAFRIFEANLMKKIMAKYNTIFENGNMNVQSIDSNSHNINIKINKYPYIVVKYDYQTFIDRYGTYAFQNKPCTISYNDILNEATIASSHSLSLATKTFEELLSKEDYFIREYDESTDEIVFENKRKDEILIIKMSKFINRFKMSIFNMHINRTTYKEIEEYILNNVKRRYLKKEYTDMKKSLKDAFSNKK